MSDIYSGRNVLPFPAVAQNGGPPHDGGMEARVAKLESTNEHILREMTEIKTDIRELRADAKQDFRVLFGALVFVALGLAGIMAKGFGWL